jgi:hypothetical protein
MGESCVYVNYSKKSSKTQKRVITPRYSWNTVKVGAKHQSINQTNKQRGNENRKLKKWQTTQRTGQSFEDIKGINRLITPLVSSIVWSLYCLSLFDWRILFTLWYLLTFNIVLSVLQFTDSVYPFDIFKTLASALRCLSFFQFASELRCSVVNYRCGIMRWKHFRVIIRSVKGFVLIIERHFKHYLNYLYFSRVPNENDLSRTNFHMYCRIE